MNRGKVAIFVAAALVAGLALGSVGIASAATTVTPGTLGAGLGGIMRQAGGTIADIVAKLTGQTVAEVRADREAGKSFEAIAAEKSISADKVAAEVLAARKTAVDASVKAGTITQAQADAALARMKTRVTTKITSAAPAGCDGTGSGAGRGAGAGRGMMGAGRGAGAGACGGVCATP
jgi:hypothetical protein